MPKKKPTLESKTRPVNIEFNIGEFETMTEFIKYVSSPRKIFFTNFFAGTMRGLGFIIGATAFLTLVAYIIGNVLANIPFVGEIFGWVDAWLSENLSTYQ
ncbi:MAG: DUF5665 domain-containing protein [Patescibacteria group bacterium]|nr:hypothetical protein [Patescibacteria group bacterium]